MLLTSVTAHLMGIIDTKGQFGNAVAFKIIIVSCPVEIISCEENQLSVW